MVTTAGILLTDWTARTAVGCYLLRLMVDAAVTSQASRDRWSRWIWTAGCLALLAHVGTAFHFYHGWSHRAAWEHTARRTWEVTGLAWGGGVLVNELMALLWVADVVAWWIPAGGHVRRRGLQIALHGFFGFMMVNATVVFGPSYWKWVVPPAATIIALAAIQRRFQKRSRKRLKD